MELRLNQPHTKMYVPRKVRSSLTYIANVYVTEIKPFLHLKQYRYISIFLEWILEVKFDIKLISWWIILTKSRAKVK